MINDLNDILILMIYKNKNPFSSSSKMFEYHGNSSTLWF